MKVNILPKFDEVAEVVETSADNSVEFVCDTACELLDYMTAFQAYFRSPRRPSLANSWNGPGVYGLALEIGASQSTGPDKADDTGVIVFFKKLQEGGRP